MTHTPGPWKVADYGKPRGDVIAVCKGLPQKPVAKAAGQQDPDERMANARLIAAAPEMLDVLTRIRDSYRGYIPDFVEAVNKVIDKATPPLVANAQGGPRE